MPELAAPRAQWSAGTGLTTLGDVEFHSRTEEWFRQHIERPFLHKHLCPPLQRPAPASSAASPPPPPPPPAIPLPRAVVFQVGMNQWREFDAWPPTEARPRTLHFRQGGRLTFELDPAAAAWSDEFVSDPQKPVPYSAKVAIGMTRSHMTDDQRFAASRPDVLVYETAVLEADLTLVGPFCANLCVSTSGTDADFVVKLIDCYSGDHANPEPNPKELQMGGFQQLVRAEPFRGKFRNSFEVPEPFVPGEQSTVRFELPDVFHTFRKGHTLMVHVQSTFFPLVDRNPQTFCNIYECGPEAFVKATHRVHDGSSLEVLVL
jgi:putative CocE/NonD family hydrolase